MTVTIQEPNAATGEDRFAAIERAIERARLENGPVIVSEARRIAAADPIDWFASLELGEPAIFWQAPRNGVAFVGRGALIEWTGAGATRFSTVSQQARNELARVNFIGGAGQPEPVVRAFGGFAFDPEKSRADDWRAFPDAVVTVPEVLLRIENGDATLTASVVVAADSAPGEIARLLTQRLSAEPEIRRQPAGAGPALTARQEIPAAIHWKSIVAGAAADVRAGVLDKIVLARSERVEFDEPVSVAEVLTRARAANPESTVFAIRRQNAVFLGASPELLVRLTDGIVETTPLAGSIRRGETDEGDDRLARRLRRRGKDRTEHEVVVGAVLQALAPMCDEVTVDPESPLVVRHRSVQHLATPVRGLARPGFTAIDFADALHPTPAVGGYPTARALAAIRDLEGFDRGWYAGPIGWIDPRGDGEFVLGLRSALIAEQSATLYAGCGIVGDSDPEQELAETRLKLRPMSDALGIA